MSALIVLESMAEAADSMRTESVYVVDAYTLSPRSWYRTHDRLPWGISSAKDLSTHRTTTP